MFSLYRVTRAAIDATSKLLQLQLRGLGAEDDDDGSEPADDQPVLSQLGFAVLPVVGRTLRAIGEQLGNEIRILSLWDKARAPTDLASGETRVYSAGQTSVRIRLTRDGIVIDAGDHPVTVKGNQVTVDSNDVKLGAGATLGAARLNDAVGIGTLSGVAPPTGGPVQFVFIPAGATGPAPSASPTAVLSGAISAASSTVKVE